MLPTGRYRRLLSAKAELVSLPDWDGLPGAVWLEGLVLHESGGNPLAVRYEAHQDVEGPYRQGDPDTANVDDGAYEDDKSYGLMQLMGYNARAICGVPPGTLMNYQFLLRPDANTALGLFLLLGELHASGGDVARALARYNGGPHGGDFLDNGKLRRQDYVDLVRAAAKRVAADVAVETAPPATPAKDAQARKN